ncbi:SEC-C domain-containing protein [bacterium]|nr:SEC-C domain-containing protein [bacterium]
MTRLKIPADVPIEAKMVSNSIERAQRQVEGQNFEIRKNVLKYDEVMNTQRKVIYRWRSEVLQGGDTDELVREWISEAVTLAVETTISNEVGPEDWSLDELLRRIAVLYDTGVTADDIRGLKDVDDVVESFVEDAQKAYDRRAVEFGEDLLRRLEHTVVLSIVDTKWREHLAEMDYLRSGIGLRAMGQRDPLTEYQREGFDMFSDMVDSLKEDSVRYIFRAQMVEQQSRPDPVVRLQGTGGAALKRQASVRDKTGRNDPCPCGSGKKYKRCHGAAA